MCTHRAGRSVRAPPGQPDPGACWPACLPASQRAQTSGVPPLQVPFLLVAVARRPCQRQRDVGCWLQQQRCCCASTTGRHEPDRGWLGWASSAGGGAAGGWGARHGKPGRRWGCMQARLRPQKFAPSRRTGAHKPTPGAGCAASAASSGKRAARDGANRGASHIACAAKAAPTSRSPAAAPPAPVPSSRPLLPPQAGQWSNEQVCPDASLSSNACCMRGSCRSCPARYSASAATTAGCGGRRGASVSRAPARSDRQRRGSVGMGCDAARQTVPRTERTQAEGSVGEG